jgi:hypothetical protein
MMNRAVPLRLDLLRLGATLVPGVAVVVVPVAICSRRGTALPRFLCVAVGSTTT